MATILEALSPILRDKLIAAFNPEELEQVISGIPIINATDWQLYADYPSQCTADSPVVSWFWEYVETLDQAALRRLLFFITGATRPPSGGFAYLKHLGTNGSFERFKIILSGHGDSGYPAAQTCFYTLILPIYSSKEILIEKFKEVFMDDRSLVFSNQ
jgi:hypothetical protein